MPRSAPGASPGQARCLLEGCAVGRSRWLRRQSCTSECGILINEQMGEYEIKCLVVKLSPGSKQGCCEKRF